MTKQDDPYQKQIDETFNIISNDQTECDKQLLALSSGFLGVSLAFIKDVVKLSDAYGLWSLYTAWILLALCIMLVLFSFQFSIAGNFKAKEYWENLNAHPDLKYPYGHATAIKQLNQVSLVLFGLGVCFLVAFIIYNVHKEAAMPIVAEGSYMNSPQQCDVVQKGSNMKAPAPAPPPVQSQVQTNTSSTTTTQGQTGTDKK